MTSFRLATILAPASALPLTAQQIQISKENKTIAITTSDEASALADTAVVTVGFTAYGKEQNATYADATHTSNAIVSALMAGGIRKEAIESKDQSMSGITINSEDDKAKYAQGLRFQFSQHWKVIVPAESASSVLHIAITAGGNDSGDIQWQLRKEDVLEAQAASKALEHGRQIAEQMAKGLNAQLGALVYASNQTPQRAFYGFAGTNAETVAVSVDAVKVNLKPLAISPERITKSATVYAVFSIE